MTIRTGIIVSSIAVLVFILDAVSKAWALANLHPGTLQPFVPGILQLTLTTNTGGAFGIGREFKTLMTLLPIAICLGIIFWIVKREKSGPSLHILEKIGLALILGGASGNIFDRLTRGQVTDFLDFAFVSFPVFNVADALIDVGVALIVLHSLFGQPDSAGASIKDAGEQNG